MSYKCSLMMQNMTAVKTLSQMLTKTSQMTNNFRQNELSHEPVLDIDKRAQKPSQCALIL